MPPASEGLFLVNPPYGVRVGGSGGGGDVRNLYAQMGLLLRERFRGWGAGMLSADPALERQVGLEWRQILATSNGGIPVRFVTATVA
jgi:putative N6-adenine-specific DNA methylase